MKLKIITERIMNESKIFMQKQAYMLNAYKDNINIVLTQSFLLAKRIWTI